MIDFLLVFLGVELIMGVIAFLGGGPFGEAGKVFVALNCAVGVISVACGLIYLGLN